MGFSSRAWFWRWAAGSWSGIKTVSFCLQALHSVMSNIIPLPFESTLSASYTDASELAQAMQHLERHLAHILNIRVTSKCLLYSDHDLKLTNTFVGLLEAWPVPSGVENIQMQELIGFALPRMSSIIEIKWHVSGAGV